MEKGINRHEPQPQFDDDDVDIPFFLRKNKYR
jgi:hypothetical protein